MSRVLLVDWRPRYIDSLSGMLVRGGCQVQCAFNLEEGLAKGLTGQFQVVLAALYWKRGSRMEPLGLELLAGLRSVVAVVLTTETPNQETIIKASAEGAYDYLITPSTFEESKQLLETVRQAASSRLWTQIATSKNKSPIAKAAMLGRSRSMQRVYKQIGRMAHRPVSVLILGETGTGKELIARAIHDHSKRKDKLFVAVNCGAIPDTLVESELFGHEPGAFTDAQLRKGKFEQAHGGTLFLDEIGDISLATQAKLLRVLQDHKIQRLGGSQLLEVDVRLIAATHRNLEQNIADKTFRRDLYYRLNDGIIRLPPLRERKSDIPELVHFFARLDAAELLLVESQFEPEALDFLKSHSWPGNIRELRNVVRKALLLARGNPVNVPMISEVLRPKQMIAENYSQSLETLTGKVAHLLDAAERGQQVDVWNQVREWAEREIYTQVIELVKGNELKAAKLLGVARQTMRLKLTQYGIEYK